LRKKSGSFGVKGTPKVTIDARNCSVYVRGWDKQEVQYSVTRFSRIQNQPPLDPTLDVTESNVSIKIAGIELPEGTPMPGNVRVFSDLSRARIEVFVPKKSNLRILTNREIRLENVSGDVSLQGEDDSINVRDVDGKLSVTAGDGRIRVIGFRGAFDGKIEDGMMNLEGNFQSFNATVGEGTIILTLPENANALFEANTDIESEGLNLIHDNNNEKIWHIGKGGTLYRMVVGDGKVFVRNASGMQTIGQ